ncbi:uncharacterized protein LOC144104948 [Amblyomma americanum]
MTTEMSSLRIIAAMIFAYGSTLYYATGGARNSSCLEEPILENCTTVRLLWRFMPSRNKCEAGFVCTDNKNAFETEEKCNATCPPVPPDEPKPKKHNCKYWLSHQYLCHKTSMKMHYDKKNRLHRVLWMTHCKEEERKVYSYDSVDRKCKDWPKDSTPIPK